MDVYYYKYKKYKTKYLNLKDQIGGKCDEYEIPLYQNEKMYVSKIKKLNLLFHIIGHAYKHRDTLFDTCCLTNIPSV